MELNLIPLLKIVRGELSQISLSVVPADSLLSCKPLILYSPILEKTAMHLDGFSFFLLHLFSYIRLLFLVLIRKESSTVKGFLDWYYWLVHLLGGTTPTYSVLRPYYPVLETELRHIPSLLRVWFGFSFCRCFRIVDCQTTLGFWRTVCSTLD